MKLTCLQLEKILFALGFHQAGNSCKYAYQFGTLSQTIVFPYNKDADLVKPIYIKRLKQFLLKEEIIESESDFDQLILSSTRTSSS